MRKALSFLGGLILIGIIAVLLKAATMPTDFVIEEEVAIAATPDKVFSYIGDLKRWEDWSPWKAKDATIVNSYSEVTDTVGATQSWESKESGSGSLQFTGLEPQQKVDFHLVFADWDSESDGTVSLVSKGETTLVKWQMTGKNQFVEKLFWVIFNLESAMKKDFQFGLNRLKLLSEGKM